MSSTNGHTPNPPGVSHDVAHERGYVQIMSFAQLDAYQHQLTQKQQRQTPGLLVPIYRLGESVVYTYVLRPDKPRIDASGSTIKYEWPAGVDLCLDVLPRYHDALCDASIPIWITEGAKKADALASALGSTIVPISINGVWAWGKNDSSRAFQPLPDLDAIDWTGRAVVLAFDSDVLQKSAVQSALRALAKHLKGRGAKVRILILPDDGSGKVGVDDAIAGGMTAAQLLDLVGDLSDLPKETQADKLLTIGLAAELFKTPDGEPFALCQVRNHREAYGISERGGGLRHWLIDSYFAEEGKPPSSTALAGTMDVLRARAIMRGSTRLVHTRSAWHDGRLYLDLTNDGHEAVEVDAAGWRIVTNPPVIFRRASGALPLPRPVAGGTLDELRTFLNLGSDDDWLLVAGWLLSVFLPTGAFPHLAIDGEQGSAKTTTTRMLRGLVDPSNADTRAAPKDEQDLAIAASNSLVVVCDNASRLSDEMSDAFCRLSTGAALSTRKLYTDDEEKVLSFKRPVIMNGITEFITRGDLADRTMMVTLRAIPEAVRKPEDELWTAYDAARPRMLGALLDAVSTAIRNRDMPRPARLPRLADVALWVERAAPRLDWKSGAFIEAYGRMRDDTSGALIEASPVAPTVLQFARDEKQWTGTADELLSRLNKIVDAADRPKGWPGTARALGDALRRIAPPAHAAGVNLEFKRSHGVRLWSLSVFERAEAGAEAGAARVPNGAEGAEAHNHIGTASMASQTSKGHMGAEGAESISISSVQTQEKEEGDEKETEEEAKIDRVVNPAAPAAPRTINGARTMVRSYLLAGQVENALELMKGWPNVSWEEEHQQIAAYFPATTQTNGSVRP